MTKQFSEIELQLYVECVHLDFSRDKASDFFKSMGETIDFEFLNILREEYGKEKL